MFMHEKIISLVQISKIWPSAHSAPIHMPFLHQELLFPVTLDTSKPQDHSANFSLPTRRLSSACPVLLEWLFGSCQIKVHLLTSLTVFLTKTPAPPLSFPTLSPFSDIPFPISGKIWAPQRTRVGEISLKSKQKVSNIRLSKKKNHFCLPWIWLIEPLIDLILYPDQKTFAFSCTSQYQCNLAILQSCSCFSP